MEEVIKLKHICTTLLIFSLLFVLVGCATRGVTVEDLVGVWRTGNFLGSASNPFAAVYITADGNLYVLLTTESEDGPITDIYNYYYEIVDDQLVLTPMEDNRHWLDAEAVEISISRNNIQLDMQEVFSWVHPQDFLFTLSHYTDELPYGWTNADRQEMQETTEWIRNQILSFAEQFSEELGLPVLPQEGRHATMINFTFQHVITFSIEDILIDIAFIGELPTPTRPQRHTNVRGPSPLMDEWDQVNSANHQFRLAYSVWEDEIPEEWRDTFTGLDDFLPE